MSGALPFDQHYTNWVSDQSEVDITPWSPWVLKCWLEVSKSLQDIFSPRMISLHILFEAHRIWTWELLVKFITNSSLERFHLLSCLRKMEKQTAYFSQKYSVKGMKLIIFTLLKLHKWWYSFQWLSWVHYLSLIKYTFTQDFKTRTGRVLSIHFSSSNTAVYIDQNWTQKEVNYYSLLHY